MITIIISSANNDHLQQVKENIAATIGVPYEIIVTDNKDGSQGICEIYNKSLINARYDILCFMHEDVNVKTDNWGKVLLSLFKADANLGLVGVAGNSYKTLAPSGLGGGGNTTHYLNLIQSYKYQKKKSRHTYNNPDKQSLAKVVCVDGVFMATTRAIAEEFMFDEITLKGFHGYDIDFSLSVSQKYKVAVTFDILLDHFSEGLYNNTWMAENIKLHNKWNKYLPIKACKLTAEQIYLIEKNSFKSFIDELIRFNYPISAAFKMLWKNKRFFQLNSWLFFKLKYHTLKMYIRS